MTESVAAPDWSFGLGEVVVFPQGSRIPPVLELNSEVFTGSLPHRHRVFDPDQFARLSAPKPVPAEEPLLDAAAVLKHFGWSDAQLTVAIAQCGFPKPERERTKLTEHGYYNLGLWAVGQLNRWVAAIKSLRLEPHR